MKQYLFSLSQNDNKRFQNQIQKGITDCLKCKGILQYVIRSRLILEENFENQIQVFVPFFPLILKFVYSNLLSPDHP